MKRQDVPLSGGAAAAGLAFAGPAPARASAAEIAFDVNEPAADMHAAVRMMGSADGVTAAVAERGFPPGVGK